MFAEIIMFAMAVAGVSAAAAVALHVGRWIVSWARRAIRAAFDFARRGLVMLKQSFGAITAYALGMRPDRQLQLAEEVTVDPSELPPDVVEALENAQVVYEVVQA